MENKKKWRVLLFSLVILHLTTNIIWLSTNNAPPSWDAANHTSIAINIAQSIRQYSLVDVLRASNYYPIFVHTISAIIIIAFGPVVNLIQFTGTIFFIISLFALYLYAKLLTGKDRVAFLATAIFSFSPIIFDQSRRMMLDIPLTSLFILSLYALKLSDNFSRRKYTFIFFALVGCILLTKWTGLIFLIIPVLFSAKEAARSKRFLTDASVNFFVGSVVAAVIALPWYLSNYKSLTFLLGLNASGENVDPVSVFTIVNLFYYLKMIVNYLTTPLITVVFIAGFIYVLLSQISYKWLLVSFVFFNYAIFTFVGNKDPRYIMPMVPVIAIFIALLLERALVKIKLIGAGFSIVFISLCALYFLILTIRPLSLEGYTKLVYIPGVEWVNVFNLSDSMTKRYETNVWPSEKIINDIGQGEGVVVVAYESEFLNPSTLNMFLKRSQYQGKFIKNAVITPDFAFLSNKFADNKFPNEVSLEEYLRATRFVLISEESTGVDYVRNKPALEQIKSYVQQNSRCSQFVFTVAPVDTACFIAEGEVLHTTSDVIVEAVVQTGDKEIMGPAFITCPWGCSFSVISKIDPSIQFVLIKSYTLPNSERIMLYEAHPAGNTRN